MEIEFWPIDRPVPYAKNPRKIPQSAIDKVAASIKEFGWRQPVVVDAAGVIVVGHTRLLAARGLGLSEVPVHVAADLTEAQCRAYRIADNRVGEEARWDDKLLKLEVSELGVLAELTGLDPKEMGRLGLAEDAAQDPIPAPPASPVARLGQIWQLGKHRLMCGDSTRPEYVSRLMGDERAILFATDPPYAVNYSGGSHPATRANRAKANRDKDWSKVYHEAGRTTFDNEDGGGDCGRSFYLAFYKVAIERAIAPHAAWYTWHASSRQAMLEAVWNEVGAFNHQQVIWFKSRPVLTYSVYMWAHEPCLFGWIKGQKPLVDHKYGNPGTVWQVPNAEVESSEHPTSKPNRLFAIPMELHTRPGDLCFEPFSGSGSQLIAAEQLGRRCYAIELEPRFVDVAVARWETLTGQKAELVDSIDLGPEGAEETG
ncbi:DNA modification methylase [Candidatus Binatus sp.]|uniref:DNA modification methylase n=1 Tax=Candidatus Binatus sp. TaxID=2811406 RepID=UPI003F96BA2A